MSERDEIVRPVLVLIAEDEGPIAEVVSYVVEDAGYTPMVVADGRQALDVARAHWPALVITDLMMPRVNGAELIAALRAEAALDTRRLRPPVILITAAGATQAQAAGADAVLHKPFDLAELEDLLSRFLAGLDRVRR
jgi:CheY-like chemotaxis protein